MRVPASGAAIVVIAASVVGLLALALTPVFSVEERLGLDILYALRGPVAPEANVIVIALSSEAARNLGLGNAIEDNQDLTGWPRSLHTDLLALLQAAGVRTVVFDIHFRRPSDPAVDEALAAAIRAMDGVILFESLDRDTRFPQDGSTVRPFRVFEDRVIPPMPLLASAATTSVPFPLPDLPKINQFWAFVQQANDSPSLPVAAFALYAWAEHLRLERELGSLLESSGPDSTADLGERLASIRRLALNDPDALSKLSREAEPTERRLLDLYTGPNSLFLNYYGPPQSITTVRADQALLSGLDPNLPWRDAIVFVGYSERAQSDQNDVFYSYYSQRSGLRLSGVEIAATALANLIEDRILSPLPGWAQPLLVLVFGGLLGICFRIPATTLAFVAVGSLLAGYTMLADAAFKQASVWLPIVTPVLLQGSAALLIGLTFRYSGAEARRAAVTRGTSRYLPSELVARIAVDPDAATRSSEVVHGVCMVTDIEQYTHYSESMAPKELEVSLNAYYDQLFDIVTAHGGLVTDIVGDSMVAVWRDGTPAETSSHAPVAAALSISQRLTGEQSDFARTRIGLHRGEFVLGTVGARDHLEYRAVGDTINTAARIQALNKQLATTALATSDLIPRKAYVSRDLGTFQLAGKQHEIRISELISITGDASPDQLTLSERFGQSMQLYRTGRWPEALHSFESLLADFVADGPSRFYAAEIRRRLADHSFDRDDCTIRFTV